MSVDWGLLEHQSINYLELGDSRVEQTFLHVVIDLHHILVLDGIDQLPELCGFRIRSYDLYGPLPEIVIKDTGDRYPVLDEVERDAAKLCAMVRVRDDLAAIFPGCEFLLPIRMETGPIVGLKFDGKTVLAEDETHWEAYHLLLKKVEAIL